MNNTFKALFGPIHADEELKNRTRAFLERETRGYSRAAQKARSFRAFAAACACILLMLLGGRWLYFTPTAKICIDINPSIELGVNRFDRVISVNGFNEDGRELSGALDVKYKNYAQAIEEILSFDSVRLLLAGDEVMTITVVGWDERQGAKILSGVEQCTAQQDNTYCYFAHSQEVADAHESGLSCGKYRAFLELQRLYPDITPETVQGMTMREIWELLGGYTADSGNETPSHDDWENGHHGHGGGHESEWGDGREEHHH